MTGIVVLTGGLVALSLLATNPQEESSNLTSIARAPASLVGMALTPAKETNALLERTSVLEFDCNPPESATVTPEIRQVRIHGRLCGETSAIGAEILNLTNGFTATVFIPTPESFTSDYIHLADGANRLRITYLLAGGERLVREFGVKRP
jgi:hypothetical protein